MQIIASFSTMRAVILTVFMLSVIMLNAQLSCGLFKKNMTIKNDATSWSVIVQLSIMLLESSIMLPENIYSTGIAFEDHYMTIKICL
jgi:hypothetical protein